MAGERFEWFYMGAAGQIGPLSDAQIFDLAEHAAIKSDTLVWKVGMEGWAPAGSVPGLANRIKPQWTPPAPPSPPVAPPPHVPGQAGISCPRCATRLRHDLRSGIEIDWCPNCRGVWLDRGELEKLIDREGDDDRDDRDRDRPRGRRRGVLGDVFDIFD